MITNTKMLQDPVAAYLQKNDLKFIWDSAKEFGMGAASLKYLIKESEKFVLKVVSVEFRGCLYMSRAGLICCDLSKLIKRNKLHHSLHYS